MKQKLKTGDEWDVVSRWARRYLCYLQRAGTKNKIKTRLNRRSRHDIRMQIREGRE